MKDREFWQTARCNNATFAQYYNRLVELSVAMFNWTGLPDTIDPRFLELVLFTDGQAVLFKDDILGFLGLHVTTKGKFNEYRIPLGRRAFAANGYQKELTDKDSVIIYNNFLRLNSMLDVRAFAERLYNLDRAIDVNANAQKTPILIQCDESQRLTLKNIYMKYDGNVPVIYGDKGVNPNAIKAISTGAPYVADRLYELKTKIWNEALTYLGIPNASYQKKERYIQDEVAREQGGTIASRYSRLIARQQGCEQFNKMFGTNIWCEFRDDLGGIDTSISGGFQNEQIYN